MKNSEFFSKIIENHLNLSIKEIKLSIKEILKCMILSLIKGKRIEIRGFGSFSLHYKKPRIGCNPKTGNKIKLKGKYIPYFKPGKILRTIVID
ncbi:HU family DNA-binding protein [Buchnera aphidicola]|nr:HU family DNA-binding protein [Buchnera aphidicola]